MNYVTSCSEAVLCFQLRGLIDASCPPDETGRRKAKYKIELPGLGTWGHDWVGPYSTYNLRESNLATIPTALPIAVTVMVIYRV